MLHVNGKFAPLKTMIESMSAGPMVTLTSRKKHVPEIKHRIRVVKEHCRDTRHRLLFTRIPKILMIHIVLNVAKMLNHFPTKGGISNTLIPEATKSGETIDYRKKLCP